MYINAIFLLFVSFYHVHGLKKKTPSALVQGISDLKEFKKIIKTKTNVLVAFSKDPKETTDLQQILEEAANAMRGTATLMLIDCNSEARKICKNQKVTPEPSTLKYYKEGEFKKEYDRKMTVSSINSFLLDPLGDIPWDEDDAAQDIVHLADPQSYLKLLKTEKKPILVMFYAPWCGFCKRMKPDYSKAATELKTEAVLAAMDVNKPVNDKIRYMHNITGFPTLMYFKPGEKPRTYEGDNNKDAIVGFMRNPDQPLAKPKEEEEWSDVESDVEHLNSENFDQFLKENPSTLVMFYAPWCGHCKRMKPVYETAALKLKEQKVDGILAAVDVTKSKSLGERFGITGYPSLKYFKDSEFVFDVSFREENKIIDFMKDPKKPPPPPPSELPWNEEADSEIIFLNDENFKPILKRKKHALVMFYAPWCGHCKKAKPEYKLAAENFKDDPKVVFTALDCTLYNTICSDYDVNGFPTFKYFSYFKTVKDYEGGRTAKHFIAFMEEPDNPQAGKEPPPPPPEVEWSGLEGSEDLVHLGDESFEPFIQNRNVMVMYYAPWCGHCKKMKPVFAKVAKKLKELALPAEMATLDATIHHKVAKKSQLKGFPTIKFHKKDGSVLEYNGDRSSEDIIQFIRAQVRDEL
ncbi:protein disulfide-isomerase A5-like isoform X1 [Artemia franciscana]|uniref:protein disulfide-isomerase A5-like isoform X1 n=1 Tax=Artemia franciscana TaxID=6661 RepID=UPI0032DABA1D